jgi:integrase
MTTQRRRPRRSWGKLRKRASGRWEASYMGPDLARHSAPMTFVAKMDAEHWLASERRLIDQDAWTPPKYRAAQKHTRSQSLGDYADTWLEQRDLKPRTRKGYRELLDGPLASLWNVPLALLSPERVRTWHTGMGTSTPRKREHAYQVLHAILNTAVADGRISANPCVIRGAMSNKPKRQAVILTPDEVAKVALAMQPPMLKTLVLVSAWCGLRWGEVTELRRKDVSDDGEGMVIVVSRACTHRGVCDIDTTKTEDIRTLDVPPHIVPDLREHLASFVDDDPEALLFPAPVSECGHYNERTMRDKFGAALKAVGITKKVRIYDLRHFCGSHTARVANLVETQARLGHTTVRASMIYQQQVNGRGREVAADLSKLAQAGQDTVSVKR